MFVTVTSIKLKSVWLYFKLTYNAMHIVKQCKAETGFIKMKNTGFGYNHFTLSLWKTEEDLKRFAKSGAHLEAMKLSRSIATEIRTYTYKADEMPAWGEAKTLLAEKGKVIKY